MIILGILFYLAIAAGALFIAVSYTSHISKKEERQREEARLIEKEKLDYEKKVRDEYQKKEADLIERERQLKLEKDQIERNKRFIYDNSVYPPRVSFVKDNFDDYIESIPAPYLCYITSLIKVNHQALNRVLEITKEEFSDFVVSPNFSVNLASFLVYYADSITWKYNGEFRDVSRSIEQAAKKLFLLCGFNDHMDASNLNDEYRLFHDTDFFFFVYNDEVKPFRCWNEYISSDRIFPNESTQIVFNLFMDASFFSPFFSSSSYKDIYSYKNIQDQLSSVTPAQQFFLASIENFLIDFKNDLTEALEKDFSETKRSEYNAVDNDDLAYIYGYESKDYILHEYYFPYPRT